MQPNGGADEREHVRERLRLQLRSGGLQSLSLPVAMATPRTPFAAPQWQRSESLQRLQLANHYHS